MDVLENPALLPATILVTLAQILSAALLAIGLAEYRRSIRHHRDLLGALAETAFQREQVRKAALGMLAWIYVALSLVLIIGTSALFLWQPHIL